MDGLYVTVFHRSRDRLPNFIKMNHLWIFMLVEIIALLILAGPMVWERRNDRRGDFNKKGDVIIRALLMALVSIVNYLLRYFNFMHIESLWHMIIGTSQAFLMSIAEFFLIFDYSIAKKFSKDPFSYLGKSGWFDNLKWWRGFDLKIGRLKISAQSKFWPWWRFFIRILFFIVSFIIYFQ